MSRKRNRASAKGRASRGPFIAMPREVLRSPAWDAMSGPEMKLLMALADGYIGSNNGNLSCAWVLMQKRGFVSKDTLARALAGLLKKGLLVKTRQGGRGTCSLFAITWEGIDPCDGKHDAKPWPVASNAWRDWQPLPRAISKPPVLSKRKIPAPTIGASNPDHRGEIGSKMVQLPRWSGL